MGQLSTFYPNPGPSQAEKFCKEEIRMRNLKRALSLTLASVMLLGMMVVGTSAAAGYSDVDADDNVEAIEVLQAVEVMVGDDRGFGPDRPVTRAEMAVVMGKLLNLDYNYYVSTCPFADVSGNFDWAKGWVGACAANGIVSGRGDGIYDPAATVTAVEAASMMMRALGYFRYQNDYADGFMVSTVRQGTKIGIFEGVGTDAATPMTRNQVAQMALNALKSGMVEPDGNTINLTTPDGAVFTGKVNYVFVTSAKPYATAISSVQATAVGSQNGGPIVELGEQLYNGKLKLNDNQLDAFDRPARRWEYDGKEIGTYVKKELLKTEYTTEVTGKMLYDLLGPAVTEIQPQDVNTYRFVIAIDGENAQGPSGTLVNGKPTPDDFSFNRNDMIRTNTDGVGGTGNGVLTQVYVDGDKKIVYIAVMNTYLGIAAEDYDERNDEVDLDVYTVEDTNNDPKNPFYVKAKYYNATDDSINITIPGDRFAIEDVKDGDMFLIRVANGEVQEMVAPEVISDATATAFKMRDDDSPEYVIANGKQYDAANTAQYDIEVLEDWTGDGISNLKNLSYNVILDHYGYMIGVELNEEPNQYVFITGNEGGSSNLGNKNVDMGAIFLDGTFEVITVNVKDSKDSDAPGSIKAGGPIVNTWCTYSVDKNGVYTLKQVADEIDTVNKVKVAQYDMNCKGSGAGGADKTIEINKKHVSLDASATANAYGNDDTVYLNVSLTAITSKTEFTDGEQDTATGVSGTVDGSSVKYHTNGTANDTEVAAIIDEVESVTVGVKNADIKATDVTIAKVEEMDGVAAGQYGTDVAMPLNEVYTLYDKDMYAIAVVVIGEAQYSNSSYAYVNSNGINREGYDADADEWTWTREAIVNGEVVTLTEVGSSIKYLDELVRGHWYKLTYDADNNVRGYTELDGTTGAKTLDDANYDDGFISRVDKIETAVDEEDFVILRVMFRDEDCAHTGKPSICDNHYYASNYQTDGEVKGVLTFKNGTLYTDAAQTEGFSVSPTVKVILAQSSATKEFNKLYTNYPAGYTGLERALRALELDDDDKFSGDVSAILEGGVATTIIINDIGKIVNGEGGGTPTPTPTPTGVYSSAIDSTAGIVGLEALKLETASVDDATDKLSMAVVMSDNIPTQIKDALAKLGYTDVTLALATGTYTITGKDANGMARTLTYKPGDNANGYGYGYYKLTVNSKLVEYVKAGEDSTTEIPAAADTTYKGTGLITADKADMTGNDTYVAYAATTAYVSAASKDVYAKTGYVEVTYTNSTGSDVTDGVAATKVGKAAGAAYAAVGASIEVKVVVGAADTTGATAASYVTLADGTASADSVITGAEKTVTAAQCDAGATLTWSVKAGEKDMALSAALSDTPATP